MPIIKYQDPKTAPELLAEGEYTVTIVKGELAISQGKKTNGSEVFELSCEVQGHGNIVYERLTFHDLTQNRIFACLSAIGCKCEPGSDVDVTLESFVGGQGRCKIVVEDYVGKGGDKRQANKIAFWLFGDSKPKAATPKSPVKPQAVRPSAQPFNAD